MREKMASPASSEMWLTRYSAGSDMVVSILAVGADVVGGMAALEQAPEPALRHAPSKAPSEDRAITAGGPLDARRTDRLRLRVSTRVCIGSPRLSSTPAAPLAAKALPPAF